MIMPIFYNINVFDSAPAAAGSHIWQGLLPAAADDIVANKMKTRDVLVSAPAQC